MQPNGTMHRHTLEVSIHPVQHPEASYSPEPPPFKFDAMIYFSCVILLRKPNNGRDESSHAVANPALFTIC